MLFLIVCIGSIIFCVLCPTCCLYDVLHGSRERRGVIVRPQVLFRAEIVLTLSSLQQPGRFDDFSSVLSGRH